MHLDSTTGIHICISEIINQRVNQFFPVQANRIKFSVLSIESITCQLTQSKMAAKCSV